LVRIRLRRTGRRHRASFRIVACDARSARDGKVIETLGSYDPEMKDESQQVQVNADRVEHWIKVGAQPSDTVANLLRKVGIRLGEVRAKVKAEAEAGTKTEAGK
jgi:small subunit ribosomal protein S16